MGSGGPNGEESSSVLSGESVKFIFVAIVVNGSGRGCASLRGVILTVELGWDAYQARSQCGWLARQP